MRSFPGVALGTPIVWAIGDVPLSFFFCGEGGSILLLRLRFWARFLIRTEISGLDFLR